MKDDRVDMQSEIIIYQTEDGNTKIDVKFEDETVWLTQQQMAELLSGSKLIAGRRGISGQHQKAEQ